MALDRSLESMFDVWQVHSDRVVCAEAPRPPDEAHLQADAILTDQPGVTLFMRFADCVPVFLYDPVQRVVGLAHAGWQGTVKHTVARAVEAMVERYSSRPSAIVAGIGPSIAAHHYPVGPEVAQQVRRVFGEQTDRVLQPIVGDGGDSRVQFDLWGANRIILERSGVHQVENSGICSACHLEDWYSHRGEKGRTGRFGAVIALPN
jgi:YfiH family protein